MQSRLAVFARLVYCFLLIFLLLFGSKGIRASSYFQNSPAFSSDNFVRDDPFPKGKWVSVPSPTPYTLLSCDFTAPDNGWAVGFGIFHWDGEQWNQILEKEWPPYYSVKMLSETDGWIVGAEGAILHWDGKTWSQVDSPTKYDLYDLSFTSSNRGWAVGGDPDYMALPGEWKPDRILIEWNGKVWKEAPFPKDELVNLELTEITMITPTNGWALGDEVYHWDGKLWENYQVGEGDTANIFLSISALSTNNVWMAGYTFPAREDDIQLEMGVIYNWNGIEWSEVFRSDKFPLFSIHMVAADFGWAVGGDNSTSRGGSTIVHWDGKTWQEIPSPTNLPLQDVFAVSKTDGWILAGGFSPDAGYKGEIFRYVSAIEPTSHPTRTLPSQFTPTNPRTSTVRIPITTATNTVTPSNVRQPSNTLFSVAILSIIALLILLFLFRSRK